MEWGELSRRQTIAEHHAALKMDPASLFPCFLVILASLAVVLECFWFSILVFKGLLAVFVTLPSCLPCVGICVAAAELNRGGGK